MPEPEGEPWGLHAAYLARRPPAPGTRLAREGCAGTLRIESYMTRDRVVVRCDECWKLFSIGLRTAPQRGDDNLGDEAVF